MALSSRASGGSGPTLHQLSDGGRVSFFNKLKDFRAIATRFEKHSANYIALVKLASVKVWMRFTSR